MVFFTHKGEDFINTLLRYPGGKSRAVKTLKDYFPENLNTLVSPFFGGGAIELYFSKQGVNVKGYDSFKPLINFWNTVINKRDKMIQLVEEMHPLSKERFKQLQKELPLIEDEITSAAVFYVLNRSSFSGSTLSGGMSPNHPRFNSSAIERLRTFEIKNITVQNLDFVDSISNHPDDFLYLDPPYYIKSNLYGNKGDLHKQFQHEKLAELLNKRSKWILSYNNDEYIKDLYKNYEIIYPEWAYGMGKDKESKEILVVNF